MKYMKKIQLLILTLFIGFSALGQQTYFTTAPTGSTSLTGLQYRYKAITPDSLNQLFMYWNGKYNQVYTATEANLRFAPISGGGYVPNSRLVSTNSGTFLFGGGNLGSNLLLYNDTAGLTTKTFFNTYLGIRTQDSISKKLNRSDSALYTTRLRFNTTIPTAIGSAINKKLDSASNKYLIDQIHLKANISDIQSNTTIAYADLPSDKKTYTNTALAGKDFTLTKYNSINSTALLLIAVTDYSITLTGGFVLVTPLAPNETVLLQGTYFTGPNAITIQAQVDTLNTAVFSSTTSGPVPPLTSYTTASTNLGLNTRANQSALSAGFTISKIIVWAIKAGDVRFAIAHRNTDGTYTQDAYTVTKTLVLGQNILTGFAFPTTQTNDLLTFYWDGGNAGHGALGAVTGVTNGSWSYVGSATGLGSFTFTTSPSVWGANVTLSKNNINNLSYTGSNYFSTRQINNDVSVNFDGTYTSNTGWKVAEFTSASLSGFSDIFLSNINMRPALTTSGYYRFTNSGGTVLSYGGFYGSTPFNLTPPAGWDKFQIDIKSAIDDDAVYANATVSNLEYTVTKIKGIPIKNNTYDATLLKTSDIAYTDSNYFSVGTIVNNRVINSSGADVPSTGWKYAEYTAAQLATFTQVYINNFNLRPTLTASGYYRIINSGGTVLAYGAFKANTNYAITLPGGWAKFQIDIKSPTDNDLVYSAASVSKVEYKVSKIRNVPLSGTSSATTTTYPTVQNTARRAAISFVFDDGLNVSADTMVMRMFKEKNMRCGFALVVDFSPPANIYLAAQDDGFEILGHSINHPYFTSAGTPTISTISAAENQFKTTLNTFTAAGYRVRGWATPYNAMDTIFVPALEKYYQYAYTKPILSTANSLATFNWRLSKLARVSMENNDTTQIKAAIDLAISQNRFVTFIAHAVDGVGSHMTPAKLQTILNYVATKRDNNECDVLIPVEAVNKYFFYNHNDIPGIAP